MHSEDVEDKSLKDSREEVYDSIYGRKEISYEPSSGLIGFLYRKLSRFEKNRYQAAYTLLPSDKEKLLDVGCGDGDFIFMAKNKFSECYGVDVSSLRVERARKNLKETSNREQIHFYKCNVDEGLPFSDSFFDVVSCIAVLEHVFNPPRVVKEIRRVLKPHGLFIVQVPNIAWIPLRIQLLFGKLPKTGGVYLGADWEHLHIFNKSTLNRLLTGAGFEVQTLSCSGVFSRCRKLWVSGLGSDLILKCAKSKTA